MFCMRFGLVLLFASFLLACGEKKDGGNGQTDSDKDVTVDPSGAVKAKSGTQAFGAPQSAPPAGATPVTDAPPSEDEAADVAPSPPSETQHKSEKLYSIAFTTQNYNIGSKTILVESGKSQAYINPTSKCIKVPESKLDDLRILWFTTLMDYNLYQTVYCTQRKQNILVKRKSCFTNEAKQAGGVKFTVSALQTKNTQNVFTPCAYTLD